MAETLETLGLTVRTGVAGTGLLVDINSQQSGGYVVLRADMDALAITEATGAEYTSENLGYSHSCGHDGHCAALAAAGAVLMELRDAWRGRIRLLFQPAEESAEGARSMIAAGALDPLPDAILSLHGWPGLKTGAVAGRNGTMLASCDILNIHIKGKGGHGARPHLANNPLVGAARVVDRLSVLDGAERVVSMCMARVGEQANVIADSGQLAGTVRALTPAVRDRTLREIRTTVAQACGELGMTADVASHGHSPAVVTDRRLHGVFREAAVAMLGADNVLELDAPSMGSEDFGWYLEHVPGLLFRVGMGLDGAGLHEAGFDFNDQALPPAAAVLSAMAIHVCNEGLPE